MIKFNIQSTNTIKNYKNFLIKNMSVFNRIDNPSNIESVVASLRENAYVVIEGAVSDSTLNIILAETASPSIRVNPIDLGPAIHGVTQFFTNIIAHSKTVHDIIVSPLVLKICGAYLGSGFELVNNRIQTMRAVIAMPWHTDNNLFINGKLIGKHDMPGLQFVLYLTNISASPFQLIKNSHKWSLQHESQFLTDKDIQRLNLEIIELTPPPGSLLILNTHVFHRAAPLRDSKYTRSILLFQADKISPNYPEHGEKLLVNSEFFADLNPLILSFLGFGRKRSNQPFPETSLATLGTNKLLSLQLILLRAFPKMLVFNMLRRIIPPEFLTKIKNAKVSKICNPKKLH